MSQENVQGYKPFALEFARLLSQRNYPVAYLMTANNYQTQISLEELQQEFEYIGPLDWRDIGPIEVGETMDDWPDKQPSDVGWVYINIGGDFYSETVSVIVSKEGEDYKIREVEFGRP